MDRLALTTTSGPLPCVILRHHTPTGTHHDWMIDTGNPSPDAALWTARIQSPPSEWSSNRPESLILLPPHRRVYLKKQGPISSGRGRVIRVDEGDARIISIHAHGFEAELSLKAFAGSVHVHFHADKQCSQNAHLKTSRRPEARQASGGQTSGGGGLAYFRVKKR